MNGSVCPYRPTKVAVWWVWDVDVVMMGLLVATV